MAKAVTAFCTSFERSRCTSVFSPAFPGYPCSPSEEFFVGFWNVRNRRFNQNDHQATCNQPLEGGIVSNSGVGPHTTTTPRKPRTRFRPPQYGNGPARVSLAAAPAAVTMNAVCAGVALGTGWGRLKWPHRCRPFRVLAFGQREKRGKKHPCCCLAPHRYKPDSLLLLQAIVKIKMFVMCFKVFIPCGIIFFHFFCFQVCSQCLFFSGQFFRVNPSNFRDFYNSVPCGWCIFFPALRHTPHTLPRDAPSRALPCWLWQIHCSSCVREPGGNIKPSTK